MRRIANARENRIRSEKDRDRRMLARRNLKGDKSVKIMDSKRLSLSYQNRRTKESSNFGHQDIKKILRKECRKRKKI